MTQEQAYKMMDDALDRCDGTATPRICERISTQAGRSYVINRILHMMEIDGLESIQACLPHIEQELDGM